MSRAAEVEELQARLRAATLANARLQAQLERAERAAQAGGAGAPEAEALQDAERRLRQARYELIHMQRQCGAVEKGLNTEIDALRSMVEEMHAAKAATWRRAKALRNSVHAQTGDLHQLLSTLATVLGAAGCYPPTAHSLLVALTSRAQDLEGAVSAFDEDAAQGQAPGAADEQQQQQQPRADRGGARIAHDSSSRFGDSLASSTASQRAGEARDTEEDAPAPAPQAAGAAAADSGLLALHVERLSTLVGDLTRENKLLSDALTSRATELQTLRGRVAALEADARCGDGVSVALAAATAAVRRTEASWLREATDAQSLRQEVAALQASLRAAQAASFGSAGRKGAAGASTGASSPASLSSASTPSLASRRSKASASGCVTPITPLTQATPKANASPRATPASAAASSARGAPAPEQHKPTAASQSVRSSTTPPSAAASATKASSVASSGSKATPTRSAGAGAPGGGASLQPPATAPVAAPVPSSQAATSALSDATRAALLAFAQQAVAGAYDSDAEAVPLEHWGPHAGLNLRTSLPPAPAPAAPLREVARGHALGALRQPLQRGPAAGGCDASTATACSSVYEAGAEEEARAVRQPDRQPRAPQRLDGDDSREDASYSEDPLMTMYGGKPPAEARVDTTGGSWTSSTTTSSSSSVDTSGEAARGGSTAGPTSGVAHMQVRPAAAAQGATDAGSASGTGSGDPSPRRRRDVTLLGAGGSPLSTQRRRRSMEAIHSDLRAIDAELGAMQTSIGKAAAALGKPRS